MSAKYRSPHVAVVVAVAAAVVGKPDLRSSDAKVKNRFFFVTDGGTQ
jgi:hypothetical protein